jgi:hypothetical protein
MAKNSSLRLSSVTNKACANPVCQGLIHELPQANEKIWRRTPKKYCSERCKQEGWILATTGKILFNLKREQRWKILHAILDQWTCELPAMPLEENNEILFDRLPTQPNPDGERLLADMKHYRCERFPSLSIGKAVKFRSGYFETADTVLQSLLESNEWFGIHILPAGRNSMTLRKADDTR